MDPPWHWLVRARGDAAFEGDREGVERGLPPHGPSCLAPAGRVQGPGDEVEALQGGLFGREVPAGADGAPVAGVDGLDRVRRADDPADLHVVVQEGHELRPGVVPQPHDRGVPLAPLPVNSTNRSFAAASAGAV